MAKKENDMIFRYLPELEDKIDVAYDKVIVDYSFLSLNPEESKEIKRMTKFLLSKETSDSFEKRFDVNRIRKGLANSNERERGKAKFVLQLLVALNESSLSEEIVSGMPISCKVIDITFQSILEEADKRKRINYLSNILKELDTIEDDINKIKQYVYQYNQHVNIRVSSSDTLDKDIFTNFLSLSKKDAGNIENTDDNMWMHLNNIFVYTGDLEEKLSKVTTRKWNRIVRGKSSMELICFYFPKHHDNDAMLSQEPKGYICKTFHEVIELVKGKRKGKENSASRNKSKTNRNINTFNIKSKTTL